MFYYVTVMNENYAQPSMPPGVEADIVRGLYRFAVTAAARRVAAASACSAPARSCAK